MKARRHPPPSLGLHNQITPTLPPDSFPRLFATPHSIRSPFSWFGCCLPILNISAKKRSRLWLHQNHGQTSREAVCSKVLSNESMKPSKLRVYLNSCHGELVGKSLDYFKRREAVLSSRNAIRDDDVNAKVEFLALREDAGLKAAFADNHIATFWLNITGEFSILSERALVQLVQAPSTYRCEAGFSAMLMNFLDLKSSFNVLSLHLLLYMEGRPHSLDPWPHSSTSPLTQWPLGWRKRPRVSRTDGRTELKISPLFTSATLASGELFLVGRAAVHPETPPDRPLLIEAKRHHFSSVNEVVIGASVCLKISPIYHAGAVECGFRGASNFYCSTETNASAPFIDCPHHRPQAEEKAVEDSFEDCRFLRKDELQNMLIALFQTLIREIQDTDHSGRSEEAVKAARRFIRSVARVYVTLLGELSPQAARKKGWSSTGSCVLRSSPVRHRGTDQDSRGVDQPWGRRDVLRRARRVVCCDLFLCWRRRSTTHRLPIGGDGGQQAQKTEGVLDAAAAGMETPQKSVPMHMLHTCLYNPWGPMGHGRSQRGSVLDLPRSSPLADTDLHRVRAREGLIGRRTGRPIIPPVPSLHGVPVPPLPLPRPPRPPLPRSPPEPRCSGSSPYKGTSGGEGVTSFLGLATPPAQPGLEAFPGADRVSVREIKWGFSPQGQLYVYPAFPLSTGTGPERTHGPPPIRLRSRAGRRRERQPGSALARSPIIHGLGFLHDGGGSGYGSSPYKGTSGGEGVTSFLGLATPPAQPGLEAFPGADRVSVRESSGATHHRGSCTSPLRSLFPPGQGLRGSGRMDREPPEHPPIPSLCEPRLIDRRPSAFTPGPEDDESGNQGQPWRRGACSARGSEASIGFVECPGHSVKGLPGKRSSNWRGFNALLWRFSFHSISKHQNIPSAGRSHFRSSQGTTAQGKRTDAMVVGRAGSGRHHVSSYKRWTSFTSSPLGPGVTEKRPTGVNVAFVWSFRGTEDFRKGYEFRVCIQLYHQPISAFGREDLVTRHCGLLVLSVLQSDGSPLDKLALSAALMCVPSTGSIPPSPGVQEGRDEKEQKELTHVELPMIPSADVVMF
ncbi:unnamed protein product [Cyprideis torosa]|uniref:Uncharacterized protein n=1 Tax=Cyprideis torosa TaxID=163714 RepID=A0A7R8WE96_9CRUS|nr:unnamed protein product [Cyprideis torosa]CAG0889223.1 unnamed protein product [Cyprideis torosa]